MCKAGDCVFGGLDVSTGSSPSIGFYVAPRGLSLTAKGNLLTQLRKPRTLVLLVYSTSKPRGPRHTPLPLKLLGHVALGNHSAGLSKIKWGLRVRGRRLGAGNYIAELEAQIGRTKTTGGPTVEFGVGRRGKLTIIAESSPARG